MSSERMAKIDRLKPGKSKLASIGAELALIQAVKDNISGAEIPLRCGYMPGGKPYLLEYPDFFYNISHSGDYAVCAAADSPIGVDIQKLRKPDMRIAERRFTEDEYNYICKDEDRNFFRIWTRKESILKADGAGITIPLNSFSVMEDTVILNNREYRFTEAEPPEEGYALCICQEINYSMKSE